MKALIALSLVAALGSPIGPANAKPLAYAMPDDTAEFRPGPGIEAAQDNCSGCHSADYITTQPPKMGETFWRAEVTKMIKAYHAPIEQTDVDAIVDYLNGNN